RRDRRGRPPPGPEEHRKGDRPAPVRQRIGRIMKFIAGAPKGETLVRFAFEGELDGFKDAARANNFSGRERELLVTYDRSRRHVVAGLGKKDKFTTEKLRRAAAAAAVRARALDLPDLSVQLPAGD